jgi:hypothetical protein
MRGGRTQGNPCEAFGYHGLQRPRARSGRADRGWIGGVPMMEPLARPGAFFLQTLKAFKKNQGLLLAGRSPTTRSSRSCRC